MVEDNRDIVACVPVKQTRTVRYPGSTELPCDACGQAILVAPSTQEFMKKQAVRLVCNECVVKEIETNPPNDIRLVPGAELEVKSFLKRN